MAYKIKSPISQKEIRELTRFPFAKKKKKVYRVPKIFKGEKVTHFVIWIHPTPKTAKYPKVDKWFKEAQGDFYYSFKTLAKAKKFKKELFQSQLVKKGIIAPEKHILWNTKNYEGRAE